MHADVGRKCDRTLVTVTAITTMETRMPLVITPRREPETASSPIRILVADDHAIWREGLIALLNRLPDMRVVGEAADGDEIVRLHRMLLPSITLIDIRMPTTDGVAAIRSIRGDFPDARILVLSTLDGDENIHRALRAGASGYLLKDVSGAELATAIRAVHSGQPYLSVEVAGNLAEHIHAEKLTLREMDVLRLVAKGLSNREIGATLFIVEGTVKAHTASIRRKLMVNDQAHAVLVAIRRGILSV